MKHLLYIPKWVEMLARLANERHNVSTLGIETHTTYAHTMKVVEAMEKGGLVKTVREGQAKIIFLTPLGTTVSVICKKLVEQFGAL